MGTAPPQLHPPSPCQNGSATDLLLVQVVANYYGSRQRFDLVTEIHWPGGLTSAPPDIPKCGFDGSGCPPDGKQHSLCYVDCGMVAYSNI